ncbi:conserved unknown protein [Ectocarpus siliculosus]|uniref:PDZ domain-containing protein n=1 Tax=Ectocarpus siliculosus TaxID=2880 RepID=D7G3E4_ECTSI|nr:conserved unknown protein [Ectocarpus siliculosus]|eukprot:CBJ33538.1 conserved unknown protein [Ectocarpus siliculosus]
MRSSPGIVARVLREKASRGPPARASRSTSFRRSAASTWVAAAPAADQTGQREVASAQGLLRAAAAVPRHGRKHGEDGGDNVFRVWGGLLAAAATVAAQGADGADTKQAASAAASGGTMRQQSRRNRAPVGELPVGRHAVADAVESASPWVVNIVSGSGMSAEEAGGAMKWDSDGVRNMGSGFVISGDGLVVTNAHVVERFADGAVVITLDGGQKLKGKVQAMDRRFDLALLKVDVPPGHELPVAKIGRSVTLRAGEFVVAMGSPQGLSKSCTLGIVSATTRRRSELVADARTETIMSDSTDFIQTDAAIASGNSGGPLIDLDGRVIGINTLKLSGTDGVGFAIPIDTAWQVIEDLRTQGRVDRPQLGMRLVTTDNQKGKSSGVMILSVTPGGAADRAGLRFGDLITEFDGKAVTTTTEVLQLIGHQVGRAIPMTVVAAIPPVADPGHPPEESETPPPPPRRVTVVTESDLPRSPPAAANGSGSAAAGSGAGAGAGSGSGSAAAPSSSSSCSPSLPLHRERR